MVMTGNLPSLSIVVPVKNVAHTIRDLMESLMKLEYEKDKIEIIIVDGNSTDGTKEIVQEYPVTLVEQEGEGLNAARNTGIKYSIGDIIAYTDGDCVIPPSWAQAIAENFLDPNVSFVGGTIEGYNNENWVSEYMDNTFFQVTPGFQWRIETLDLKLLQFPAGANMAFRRNALARIKFFDENITYGFDDLQPVEELGFKGFRIVLDPDVKVWHQHRTNLIALFKQHFNYGRGGTLLIIHKRVSRLAKWFASYLILTTFMLSIFTFTLYLGIKLNHILPYQISLGSLWFIFTIIMFYYVPSSFRSRRFWKIIVYPSLDILRGLFFTFGGIFQLFRSLVQKMNL
jgi:glycosyltransferase involved in cell wall biosynthesis